MSNQLIEDAREILKRIDSYRPYEVVDRTEETPSQGYSVYAADSLKATTYEKPIAEFLAQAPDLLYKLMLALADTKKDVNRLQSELTRVQCAPYDERFL